MKHWVNEAYQMYSQGLSYPKLESHLGVNKDTIRYHVKRYAIQQGLVYPRIRPDYELAFNLYYNTMTVKDIARYMGVCVSTVRNYIKRYADYNGIILKKSYKSQIAYNLKSQGYTYETISKMLGYENRSNCYRAIKNYKDKKC